MSDIDETDLLEALTGTSVSSLSEGSRDHSQHEELTITNFLRNVYSPTISITSQPPSQPPSLPPSVDEPLGSLRSQSGDSEFGVGDQTGSEVSALRKELFVDIKNFFDRSKYCDSSKCSCGGEPHPGWYRLGLKVLDKYPDGNAWLGLDALNKESGEWPVSYHGTGIEGAKGIATSNYTAGGGTEYGRGIYSAPDIKVAEPYAILSKYKSQNGKTYEVIMQNRVNPEKRTVIKVKGVPTDKGVIVNEAEYWFIPVPEGTSAEEEKQIVEASIRPYGILIKEVEEEKKEVIKEVEEQKKEVIKEVIRVMMNQVKRSCCPL